MSEKKENLNPFAELFGTIKQEEDIKREIVRELLTSDNLETKTELTNPLKWSCLTQIQTFVENHQMKISSQILKSFVQISFSYLISKDRKGRDEYIKALNALSNFIDQEKQKSNNPLNPLQNQNN
jgi:hypothetical protein